MPFLVCGDARVDHLFKTPSSDDNAMDVDGQRDESSAICKREIESMSFPQVLMTILSKEENKDTISWMSHGESFMIHDKEKFTNKILPVYYKKTKYTSFTRKLNRWGFCRVARGPETGAFFHKFFLRDNPELCSNMSCSAESKLKDVSTQNSSTDTEMKTEEMSVSSDMNQRHSFSHHEPSCDRLLQTISMARNEYLLQQAEMVRQQNAAVFGQRLQTLQEDKMVAALAVAMKREDSLIASSHKTAHKKKQRRTSDSVVNGKYHGFPSRAA